MEINCTSSPKAMRSSFISKSKTFIKEITRDESFGEISFFSNLPRAATAYSKSNIEALYLTKKSISSVNEKFKSSKIVYDAIQKWIETEWDLSPIGLKWYICNSVGHICLNWNQFYKIQGNLLWKLDPNHQTLNYEPHAQNTKSTPLCKGKLNKKKSKFNEEIATKIINRKMRLNESIDLIRIANEWNQSDCFSDSNPDIGEVSQKDSKLEDSKLIFWQIIWNWRREVPTRWVLIKSMHHIVTSHLEVT